LVWEPGSDWPVRAGSSRTSRSADVPAIPICSDCEQREAFGQPRLGYDAPLPPPEQWPLSIEDLLEEDRLRYERMRAARVGLATFGPEEARRILEGEEVGEVLDDLEDQDDGGEAEREDDADEDG
jgi:hypothetical protein